MAFINANKTIFLKAGIQNHIESLYIVNLIVTWQILFHKQQCIAAHKYDIKYLEKNYIKYLEHVFCHVTPFLQSLFQSNLMMSGKECFLEPLSNSEDFNMWLSTGRLQTSWLWLRKTVLLAISQRSWWQ